MLVTHSSLVSDAMKTINTVDCASHKLTPKDKRWLEHQLEKWARWVDQGSVMPKGYQSIFGLIADYKDSWVHKESGGNVPDWGIEYRIEHFLASLQPQKPRWVSLLRAEMGVCKATKGCITQRDKAQALGISMRSYAYDLKAVKQAVFVHLRT